MKRKIDFPITARVIAIVPNDNRLVREIVAQVALEIEQRINTNADLRIHVSVDEDTIPKEAFRND